MAFGKHNHVKIDPLSYSMFVLGESKIGKTTLVREVCEKLAGENGYLFLELGQEHGADAIEGINYINCPKWDMEYDELTNSAGFADVVDDIVANKSKEYGDLKCVILDTYDQLITLAEEKTINLYNRQNPDKKVMSINQAWGGYGRGNDKAIELMLNKIAELDNVGVKTIVIGHVKVKEVNDVMTGLQYNQLTSDQTQKYFNAIKKNMHIMALIYKDRKIIPDANGKNYIQDEVRKIKFRDSSFTVDSGCRFAEIAEEVDFSADDFIKAIEDAIKAEQAKSSISYADEKKAEEKNKKKFNERVKKAEEARDIEKELEDMKLQIRDFCVAKKNEGDSSWQGALAEVMKDLGYDTANPVAITTLEDAKKVYETISK